MGIFRRQEIDLSDEGLALAAEESNEIANESAADGGGSLSPGDTEKMQEPAAGAEPEAAGGEQESPPLATATGGTAGQTADWQGAAEKIAASWPQAFTQGEALVAKMVEIGSRYGDPQLWQRAPEGIMREAAIELFGWPKNRDNEYAKVAAQAARQAALKEMSRRNQ